MTRKLALGGIFVLGAALLGVAVLLASEGIASYGWPQADGTVVSHRVVREYQQGARQQDQYHAEVHYRYQVDGRSYTGSRYAVGRGHNATGTWPESAEAQRAAAERFPRGESTAIYYDPDQPGHAVLRRGIDWTSAVPAIIGAFFLFAGFWLARQPGSAHGV